MRSHAIRSPVQTASRSLSAAERRLLQRDLDAIWPPGGAQSLCILDANGVRTYDRNCEVAVTPASTQKLIVAAAAVYDLGLAYRFITRMASGARIDRGRLGGDLWLIGSGDPILVSNDLRGGVKILTRSGLRAIAGGVRVDASFLSGPERNPSWEGADAQYGFSAATSTVSLDQDTIEVHIAPRVAGMSAQVSLEPPTHAVSLSGSVRTVFAGARTDLEVVPTGVPNAFDIFGEIAAGAPQKILYVPVSGIPSYVGDVLTLMLRGSGIVVAKAPRAGVAPKGAQALWSHRSPPLGAIVTKMLFESNNHIAEQLLRTLGRVIRREGSDAAGIAVERDALRAQRIPTAGLRLVDASGLSAANRISALTLATLLYRAERQAGDPLYRALPRAGIEGTVKYYRLGAARGRVRAKSGHVAGVEALVGYVATHRYGRFAFAFLLDTAENAANADMRITRAVERLAEF